MFVHSEGESTLPTTTTSTNGTEAGRRDAVAALSVREGGSSFQLLIAEYREPAFLLVVPGNTLLQGVEGFTPLEQMASEDSEGAVGSLADLIGLPIGYFAEVSWGDFSSALGGRQGDWEFIALPEAGSEAMEALVEMLRSVSNTEGENVGDLLRNVDMTGDGAQVKGILSAMPREVDLVAILPGRLVEGSSRRYFEPDENLVKGLLGTQSSEIVVTLRVQNGSGELGAAEAVAELLQPEGYELLPPINADDFPNVTTTRIFAAPDVLAEADHIRTLLGVGQVVAEEGFPLGRVEVVVGKDLSRSRLKSPGQLENGEE